MNTGPNQQDDVVDIEQYAKANKQVPRGKRYRIRVDKVFFEVQSESLTGAEILTLAGKTPADKFILQQKVGNQVVRIELNQSVDFTTPGIERFMTIPREVQDGDGPQLRRQHELLAVDSDFLDSLGLRWEAVLDGAQRRVMIYSMPIPHGYNVTTANVSVLLGAGYPAEQIDMAYFDPPLALAAGRPITGLSETSFDKKTWQQWSRHRTGNSAWRADIDNVGTHLALVQDWLKSELSR